MDFLTTKTGAEIGGAVSFAIGSVKGYETYLNHFNHETWIRVADACIVTFSSTVLGTVTAFMVTLLLRKLFNSNEKSS